MKKIHQITLTGFATTVSALALVMGAPAAAQVALDEDDTCETDANGTPDEDCGGDTPAADTTPDGVVVDIESQDEAEQEVEESAVEGGAIVVTGSRIKQDTFSSISPLQVLTTEASQDVGAFDPSQILQRTESAAGQQIDATFSGFVLDNGPGSQTINLRGLGAERTLLLINGRRLAPAGVEGAPSAPSINLLPGSLIERYDLLLDGASSVYGSDAVAGVGNIILRKDFDGLELFASGNINPMGGGDDYTVSAAYGKNYDRGFFGVGAEYSFRDTVRLSDRDFFRGCDKNYEIDQDGNIRTVGLIDNATVQNRTPGVSVSESECKVGGLSGRIFIPATFFGSVYFQGANGNTPVPGFSESTDAFGQDVDANGDGIRDVDFQDFSTNAANEEEVFIPEQKLYNVMAYGEYTFPGGANLTPFFEANYSRAEIFADNIGIFQLFPFVPADNQFNPCNIDAPGGVDCPAADNEFLGGPFNPNVGFSLPVNPIVAIRGDRNNIDVTQEQYRGVLGIRGDLPFIAPSWTFEVAGVYSRSEGRSIRRGIRSDKLAFSLGIDPTVGFDINQPSGGVFGGPTITPCDASALANPETAQDDLTVGCVPVNLFAPSVLNAAVGEFASQAERDYLFGVRDFNTIYEQKFLQAFVTGDVFTLPAGSVGTVLGVEIREDKLDSRPDAVASQGLFYGFFTDQGATGSKTVKEAFAELNIPLQAGKPWVRELNVNLSGRVTDDEFYGTNYTYAAKMGWRPIDPLLIKFSYGTSFRAPNLRENFLKGQSGFNSLFDPCAVPGDAFDALNGGYQPELDTREQTTIDNCIREGRDPFTVGIDTQGLNTVTTPSVEITTGGTLDIDPETSRSITAGFAFEETFGDGFDVSLGFNYFDIKLKDSIIQPSSQFIINDCFTREDGIRSPFCDRITVSDSAADRFLISDINSGFINLNQESVRGIDLNGYLSKEVPLFGSLVDFGLDLRANHLIERSSTFVNDTGDVDFEDSAGTFGLPNWTGRATFTADYDKWRFTWQTRYVGPVEQDSEDIDDFTDVFGRNPDGTVNENGFFSDTCLGNGSGTNDPDTGEFIPNGNVAGDGRFCRDVGFADAQFIHTASIRYQADTWEARVGVTNIFDTAPPLVDSSEVLSTANTAIGNGYDYDGREFFISLEKKF